MSGVGARADESAPNAVSYSNSAHLRLEIAVELLAGLANSGVEGHCPQPQ